MSPSTQPGTTAPPAAPFLNTGAAPANTPATWYENDAFWEAFADSIFSPARVAATVAEVDAVLDLLFPRPSAAAPASPATVAPAAASGAGTAELAATPAPVPPPPATLLDLCCGIGRHTIELARRGHTVTGVDRTACLLARARRTLAEAAESDQPGAAGGVADRVELVQTDARGFVREGAFDGAMNLYTSFGYYRRDEDNIDLLRVLHRNLRPGGRLVMEMIGKEILARIYVPSNAHRLPDGSLLTEERALDGTWSWLDCRWTLLRPDGSVFQMPYGHWVYTARELLDRLAIVGFPKQRTEVYGSLQKAPYDQHAKRLVVVAEKPA